jgi:hypothetical protein
MSKKDFIALADMIRRSNDSFSFAQLDLLAKFCKKQNPQFDRQLWLDYLQRP